MIMDDSGWFSLLGVRRGSTGFFLEGGVLEDQWQDPMAKFYTETNLGPLSQASWSFFSVIFVLFCSVLFCSVLFCSVLWRSMITLHMTFFFSPSPCHRTGPIGQTQKAIMEARLSAAASCGAPVDGPVLSWPLKPLQLEKHPSHLLPWPDLTLPEKKSLTKPLDTRRPLSQFRAKWQWWLKFSLSNKKLNYGANVKMSCQPEHTKLHKKAL